MRGFSQKLCSLNGIPQRIRVKLASPSQALSSKRRRGIESLVTFLSKSVKFGERAWDQSYS